VRRIFIGDIQGCLEQLDGLLAEVRLRPDDRVCCVGDLVNRGPDSLGVLRRVRALGARAVLGNHDLHLLRIAAGTRRLLPADRLDDVLAAPDRAELLQWLGAQPVMRVEDDVVVVHGGVHPLWRDLPEVAASLNSAVSAHVHAHPDEPIRFATQVRYCDERGRRPARDEPPPGPPFRPWDEFYHGRRRVVFAHWARRGLVIGPRVRGLDSGCVYGRALTAWIAEEDRVVQVPGWPEGRIPGAEGEPEGEVE
jgi:bis(5'-nucleosyl)-tetraphosphatase (symmetrical)